jgi:hypothetical protein
MVFFSLFVFVFACARKRGWQWNDLPPEQEFVVWQLVMVIILVSGPLTWGMNVVWLLPVSILLLREYGSMLDKTHAISLSLCCIGLVVAGVPDHYTFPPLPSFAVRLDNLKYVLGELFVLAGLLTILDYHCKPART